jgi:hypothetical protein
LNYPTLKLAKDSQKIGVDTDQLPILMAKM